MMVAKTETGKCKTDDRTLYRFQEVNPKKN